MATAGRPLQNLTDNLGLCKDVHLFLQGAVTLAMGAGDKLDPEVGEKVSLGVAE